MAQTENRGKGRKLKKPIVPVFHITHIHMQGETKVLLNLEMAVLFPRAQGTNGLFHRWEGGEGERDRERGEGRMNKEERERQRERQRDRDSQADRKRQAKRDRASQTEKEEVGDL